MPATQIGLRTLRFSVALQLLSLGMFREDFVADLT